MTPPPRREATAQSGDTGAQASGPGGPGGAQAGPATATAPRSRKRRRLSWWSELLVLFALALSIMLVIKTYVVQAFFIPSSSMENTLDIGDKVLVNKLVYHFRSIEPGDIVVFNGSGSWDQAAAPAAASSNPIARL